MNALLAVISNKQMYAWLDRQMQKDRSKTTTKKCNTNGRDRLAAIASLQVSPGSALFLLQLLVGIFHVVLHTVVRQVLMGILPVKLLSCS